MEVLVFAVDKKQIRPNSGLQFHGPARKKLPGLVIERFITPHSSTSFVADSYSDDEVMKGIVRYIENRYQPSLFSRNEFAFRSASTSNGVQVADFYAGTFAKVLTGKLDIEKFPEVRQHMCARLIGFSLWPFSSDTHTINHAVSQTQGIDESVAWMAMEKVQSFVLKNLDTDDDIVKDQVAFLDLLLAEVQWGDPYKYMTRDEVISRIRFEGRNSESTHYFYSKIVADLRDQQILIASGSKGYKIPTNKEEFLSAFIHQQGMIMPMVRRLRNQREEFRTKIGVDPLDDPRLAELRGILSYEETLSQISKATRALAAIEQGQQSIGRTTS
jgi:hypothetical protein